MTAQQVSVDIMKLFLPILISGVSLSAYGMQLPPSPPPTPRPACPLGWFGFDESCYWFSRYAYQTIWSKAQTFCRQKGGHLVKIDNDEEQNFITVKQETLPHARWIGLKSTSPGKFKWMDGSALDPNHTYWVPNVAHASGCVAVSGKHVLPGRWDVDSCFRSKSYICERAAGPLEVDECAASPSPCDQNATCTNTIGSYICKCKTGFTGDGKTCTDINECAAVPQTCNKNADCINTVGSYTCKCKIGFIGNGTTCADVDECSSDAGQCDQNAECTNTIGSYTCKCKTGFTGDGWTCAVQWEPKGCYKLRKKVFVKRPFFVETVKKTVVLISKGDFKAALNLCRSAAERKKLNLEVIGIGTRKLQLVCLKTKKGKPPKSGNYGKHGKKKDCIVDSQGYGVGVKPKVNFVYTKIK